MKVFITSQIPFLVTQSSAIRLQRLARTRSNNQLCQLIYAGLNDYYLSRTLKIVKNMT